jgi:hypothetical protein
MRLATRVTMALVVLGFLLIGALLLATAAVGPGARNGTAANPSASRSAADNWRTHNSVGEGIPVALLLIGDFATAWIGMIGLPPLPMTATVVVLLVNAVLVQRFVRRRAKVPLSVS